MENQANDEVQQYLNEHPEVVATWGIPSAKRLARIAFILLNVLLVLLIVGVFVYFSMASYETVTNQISGLIIVIILAYAVSAVRIFQLRAEHKDLVGFRALLKQRLTGNPETDVESQMKAEEDFDWTSNKFTYICRMIGIAGLVILGINTYQVGAQDFGRTLLFDGAILVYLTGAFWNNFAFKAELLELELVERTRATLQYQKAHPRAVALPSSDDDDDEEW